MQRRDFVKNAAILALGISLEFAIIKKWYDDEHKPLRAGDLADVSEKLEADFNKLLQWLKANGWTEHLHQTLGVDLTLTASSLRNELIKELDSSKLTALRQNEHSGYDDFSGERLVQPGFPAYSLLYHTIASPRVRPQGVKEYPTLTQIDLLEDYIYALCNWEQLKAIYQVGSKEELVFAVFAYEYRPAFKTPHHAYADMVFSRTGIARVGDEPHNFDRVNRCHINKPAAGDVKKVAVIPARYGLYIARRVSSNSLALVEADIKKGDDTKDDRNDSCKSFLQPIRKVFNNDLLTNSAAIHYTETHKSEKLNKFARSKGITLNDNIIPVARLSPELVVQDENLRNTGSSFLVISRPEPMIRFAKEKGTSLFFNVPVRDTTKYDNRYFTALCTQEVENVELLEESGKELGRIYNKYQAPRNQPLFVNITHEGNKSLDTFAKIPWTKNQQFEEKLNGTYKAPLFEDSICDGRVDVNTSTFSHDKIGNIGKQCLPAFSVVTAPDFFPQVDPIDLLAFDIAPGTSNESSFYEGGVASLSTARIKPNPKMIDSKADNTADTYLAVLSAPVKGKTGVSPQRLPVYKNPASDRGYDISGFLPDVASSVFAPGWDVTYCSLDNIHEIYIGTEGLGSPFVEDMKFCSALNGMWPATSPDAARTYQGSNEADYRNPTAVPLLDKEIGICGDGPAGKAHECWGWDGEQGPYLERKDNKWMVNFTDLGRADAVDNALQGLLDMSQLRELKSNELIARMDCLKRCIHTLPQKNFNPDEYTGRITGYTYLWLVSAEKVHWGKETPAALGIPETLVGTDKSWLANKVDGEGYLYVFTNSAPDGDDTHEEHHTEQPKKEKDWAPGLKRRRLDCHQIYVCQVSNNGKLAWADVTNGTANWQVV